MSICILRSWRLGVAVAWTAIFRADSFESIREAVWPDLAKFHHLGAILQNFDHFEKVHLLFGKILSLLWQILYGFGQMFSVANGQILCN